MQKQSKNKIVDSVKTKNNIKFTFRITFRIHSKDIKGIRKGDTPLPPLEFACRPCRLWFASQNASLANHGTTNPKNLVSQIAFGKRFANSWFVFAKLNFSDENFKTRPHLNFLRNLFLLRKNRKRFFWVGRAVIGTFTDDRQTPPRPPLKRGRMKHRPLPPPLRRGIKVHKEV